MKRAKQLGDVVFSKNTLFVREFEEGYGVIAEAFVSAAGTDIVYEAPHHTPPRTLDSKQYGWIDDAHREAILAMYQAIGTTYTLTYDDDSTETVRFAREKGIRFTPLHEGSKTFTAVIPLAKVNA